MRASGKYILRPEKVDIPGKFQVPVVTKKRGMLLSNNCGYTKS